ncbi:MAG: DUF1273 domain-containing protein [Ruminococcaceae bacterium]|nr:DUF1273 domain-containing protein [Oscillospiraceae bacterium]
MRDRSNTCCFTGHRDISAISYHELMQRLEPMIMRLIKNGYKYFACGGALGFDTFAAMYIASLKMRGFDVKLVLILPCKDQTAKWSEYDKQVYSGMLSRADEVIYTAESYYNGCMQKRNRALVDASTVCICYLSNNNSSGTRQTVEYARSKGLPIINVAN